MKSTLHLGQMAESTFGTTAFVPSCASETKSLTPRRLRLDSLRRNSVQIASASDVLIPMPSTSRRPSLLTPTAMTAATETIRAPANLQVGGMSRRYAPYRVTVVGFASPLAGLDVRL